MNSISLTMSNEEYHFDPSLSASGAKTIALKSLSHFKHARYKPNPAFDIGTAVHTLVFEPQLAKSIWMGPDAIRSSKAWKERQAEADEAGALLLKPDDYADAVEMAEAVRANADAAQLLSGDLICEASVFAHDAIYGVDLRCRPDGWRKDIAALIDLKTTIDPTPSGFAKQVANLGYHIQDQFYRRVMALNGYEIDRFVFIAVGKERPFNVYVYELDWRTLEEGNAAVKHALEQYSQALKTNEWGYGYEGPQTLQIPPYAFKFTQAN